MPAYINVIDLIAAVQLLEPSITAKILWGADKKILKFAAIEQATQEDIVFIANPKYLKLAALGNIGVLVIRPNDWQPFIPATPGLPNQANRSELPAAVVLCDNPYAFFALASQILCRSHNNSHPANGMTASIHSTALIHPTARLGLGVTIGPYVTVEAASHIGDHAVIGAHCSIGEQSVIGDNTQLYPHVTLYHGVKLGNGCIVHSGSVIGADGFGFAPYQKRWIKIPQTGTVIIGDGVEIGANCTIDRGALGNTVIGHGTKLDNLIQIAHNVVIGNDCAFAANIAIAGSAIIGNRVQMGGKAGVLGHISVCDDAIISSCTLVTKSINKPGFYTGVYPIQENAEWEKNAVSLKRLNALRLQVRAIEHALQVPSTQTI